MSIDQNVVKETVSQFPQYFIERLKEPTRAEKVKEGKYEGSYGGILLIRYIALLKIRLREFLRSLPAAGEKEKYLLEVVGRPPAPPSLQRTLLENQKNDFKKLSIPLLSLSYEDCLNIYRKLVHISEDYNTEDGQIQWLKDEGFQVHLHHFWFLIPERVKKRMNKWKYMNVSFNEAIDIRTKLENISEDYNTEDGQIRWLQDHEHDLHLARFWTIIPVEVKKRMGYWKKMDMSFQTIRAIRQKLEKMLQHVDNSENPEIEKYNTEDGQIRWLKDNGYDIHLAQFWSVIPQTVKVKMTQWKSMKLTLDLAIEIRAKLENISNDYNTEDGQSRWLRDHKYYKIHLSHFWSVIPQTVKEKMTQWKYINVSTDQASDIKIKLEKISRNYNTEDGQIRWLQDNGYNIHLLQFWSLVQQSVRNEMTCWKQLNITLDLAIEIRAKLKKISLDYNSEDGQIRWLKDQKYNISLTIFWAIIPLKIKEKMTQWKPLNLTVAQSVEIRAKLEKISPDYNTEDGQICWLQDHGYNIPLRHFWTITPRIVKEKMTQWKPIDVSWDLIRDIRKKLEVITEDYNTKDGQIRWLKDHNFNIHLSQFWRIIPIEVKLCMTEWKRMKVSFNEAIEIRAKLEKMVGDSEGSNKEKYNTEDGHICWLKDYGYNISSTSFEKIIPQHVKDCMASWRFSPQLSLSHEAKEKLKDLLAEFLDSLPLQEKWSAMKLRTWTSKEGITGRTVIRKYLSRFRKDGKIDWWYIIDEFIPSEKLWSHPFVDHNPCGRLNKKHLTIHDDINEKNKYYQLSQWNLWQMSAIPTPEDLSIQKEEAEIVDRYISSLAPNQQDVIERYYDGENVPLDQLNPLIISIRQHLEKNGVVVDTSR